MIKPEPVAWLSADGERVVTAVTKDRMPSAAAAPYTEPLFTAAQMRQAEREALEDLRKRAWTNQPIEVYNAIKSLIDAPSSSEKENGND